MGSIASRVYVLYSNLSETSRPDLTLYFGSKRPELETGRSSEVKNEQLHTSNLS
jgi:hypothetical protein